MGTATVVGLAFMLLAAGGAIAAEVWSARTLMHRARSVARSAGLEPIEGTWALAMSGFRGQVANGAWRIDYVVKTGRTAYARLRIDLPRSLTFSPRLQRGVLRWRGLFAPRLEGGFWFRRGLVEPSEASVVVSSEVRARLGAHPLWTRGAIALNADHVEFSGNNEAIENAADVREAVDVLVMVVEHVLAIPLV